MCSLYFKSSSYILDIRLLMGIWSFKSLPILWTVFLLSWMCYVIHKSIWSWWTLICLCNSFAFDFLDKELYMQSWRITPLIYPKNIIYLYLGLWFNLKWNMGPTSLISKWIFCYVGTHYQIDFFSSTEELLYHCQKNNYTSLLKISLL